MAQGFEENSYLRTLYEKYGKDFFKEEIRSDYLVTTKQKEIWSVLLDLLEHFIEVCKRHDLHYFISAGTLLGAIRHGGFIPWDDDMDVYMPREDYDRLEDYKDEFSYPFFLQTPNTDKYYAGTITKLRNSETSLLDPTYLRPNELMNMGIQLDIYPIDKVRKEDAQKIRHEIAPLTMKCAAYMRHNAVLLNDYDKLQIKQYYDSQITPVVLYEKINKIASRYQNDNDADYRAMFVFTIYDQQERTLWTKACFEDKVYLPFEGLTVAAPVGYDEFLRVVYGNYMELPPVSERGQWHSRLIPRPDVPYLQAINEYLASFEGEK